MFDPIYASALDTACAIREGRISAEAVLDAHLERVARLNGDVHAVITLDEEGARRRAREADAALERGDLWGPLHGVPITIFDWLRVTGLLLTQGGNPDFVDEVSTTEGTAVARLRGAGAIIYGKSNDDHGFWGDAARFPPPNNPWNSARRISGDGGAAASVAAGFSPIELGPDGGSAIIPAHNTGIYALRPTRYRIPRANIFPDTPLYRMRTLVTLALLARTPADLRLALQVTSGPDALDTSVAPVALDDSEAPNLKTLRIAWASTLPDLPVDDEIRAGIDGLAVALARAGAHVEEIHPQVDYRAMMALEARLFGEDQGAFVESHGGASGPTLAVHLESLRLQDEITFAWDGFMAEWDVLIAPISVVVAEARGEATRVVNGVALSAEEKEYTFLPAVIAPLTGLPTVVMPLGRNHEGMPYGVQVICRRWDDMRLLAIVEEFAALTSGFVRPPGY